MYFTPRMSAISPIKMLHLNGVFLTTPFTDEMMSERYSRNSTISCRERSRHISFNSSLMASTCQRPM